MRKLKRPSKGSGGVAPSRRRDGIVVGILLGSALAVFLTNQYHWSIVQTIISALLCGATLASLYLAWPTGSDSSPAGENLSQSDLADQLADSIRAELQAEAGASRLNEPYPLPVSWGPADASLSEDWRVIEKMAAGAGWPARPNPTSENSNLTDLAGSGNELVAVLDRVPTGRLLVLGEAGAGKTMLMVRLILDLLARRPEDGPVPVLFTLTSWNPAVQDLRSWMVAQLSVNYPALSTSNFGQRVTQPWASALLETDLVMPVLDGLDEIPSSVCPSAIGQINALLSPGQHLVLTCRTEFYRAAVTPRPGMAASRVRGAAAVQLNPLDVDAVAQYLCDDAGERDASERWKPVVSALQVEGPVQKALRTPLMVDLARTIYNARSGEEIGVFGRPEELCSKHMADEGAIEGYLLKAFVQRAYRTVPGSYTPWPLDKASVYLSYIAHNFGFDIAWWRIPQSIPRRSVKALAFGLGVVYGLLIEVVAGLIFGVWTGLAFGFISGLLSGAFYLQELEAPHLPARLGHPRLAYSRAGLGCALATAIPLALILAGSAGFAALEGTPPIDFVWLGVIMLAIFIIIGATRIRRENLDCDLSAAAPKDVLVLDRRSAVQAWIGRALGFSILFSLIFTIARGPIIGIIAGCSLGVASGFLMCTSRFAWPLYSVTLGWLSARRYLPWHLMDFLADAHQRGVLRQVGAVYQFRHEELRRRLL